MKLSGGLVVILVVVGSVYGQKPCCGPKQFMAGTGATVGQVDPTAGPQGFTVYQYGAFDFSNRMFGYSNSVFDPSGGSTDFRIIQKYASGSQWLILDEESYCVKQPVTKPEPINCIPDNATFATSLYIGGERGLLLDVWDWQYSYPHDPLDGTLSFQVVHGSCAPAGASFIGTRYEGTTAIPTISTSGIFNMTLGIRDPDKWFTLPSFCDQENNHVPSRRARSVPKLNLLHLATFV